MTRPKGGVAARANANSEIHIMQTTRAMPYHTLAQLFGNGFKSWIVGIRDKGSGDYRIRRLSTSSP
jgi:hypothetical protein